MNFNYVPPKAEVMGWTPNHLADYLKKMELSGSDKLVLRCSMTGARFLNMTDNDLQKFPKLHAPMISKLCCKINKKEEKLSLFGKKALPKFPEQHTFNDEAMWDEDEFDSDDDYENPDNDDGDDSNGGYESPTKELEEAEGASDADYEPPPSEPPEDLQYKACPSLPMGDSVYIDNPKKPESSRGPPHSVMPRPPESIIHTPVRPSLAEPSPSPARREPSPQRPERRTGKRPSDPPAPQVDRTRKPPMLDRGSNSSPVPRRMFNPGDRPPLPSWSSADVKSEAHEKAGARHHTFPLQNSSRLMASMAPGPPSRYTDSLPATALTGGSLSHKLKSVMTDHRSSCRDSVQARVPMTGHSHPVHAPHPPPSSNSREPQNLDPRWYVGKMTRGEAEGCLRKVNKDGAYLVRDSIKQTSAQPFTLMVLYQNKVFNLQIRKQDKQYLLGTGLKVHETFPSVQNIISHYSHSPLLLIDAKNRTSGQQKQCLLSEPVSY